MDLDHGPQTISVNFAKELVFAKCLLLTLSLSMHSDSSQNDPLESLKVYIYIMEYSYGDLYLLFGDIGGLTQLIMNF